MHTSADLSSNGIHLSWQLLYRVVIQLVLYNYYTLIMHTIADLSSNGIHLSLLFFLYTLLCSILFSFFLSMMILFIRLGIFNFYFLLSFLSFLNVLLYRFFLPCFESFFVPIVFLSLPRQAILRFNFEQELRKLSWASIYSTVNEDVFLRKDVTMNENLDLGTWISA